ncbi:TonB-dependent receptor domain-containing protein [Fodinibius sp.]|uniref:TonB-dependent receptor domain-containing protein n=1 Tax=Fodinibius sp. TaxID=1872440 RepID=UPI00356B50A3
MRLQKKFSLTFVLFLLLALSPSAWAQHTFTGIILDESTGAPLTGAHVHSTEGDITTATDVNGEFSLTADADELTLRITFVGYKTKTTTLLAEEITEEPAVIALRKSTEAMSPVTVLVRKASNRPHQFMDANSTVNLSHDAGQFLKDSPNISGIRKGGGFGVDPVLRGFQKNQLMVEMDGVLQSQGACPNRMDPPTSHIQMEHIEEVEILKGPYALKHGPSFGGVINFKSQQPDYYRDPVLSSYVTVGYESNIDRQRYAGGIKKEGGRWTTSVYGAFASTENYEDGSGNNVSSGMSNAEYTVETSVQLNDANAIKAKLSQNFARDVQYPALMMDMRNDDITNTTLMYTNSDLGKGRLQSSVFVSHVEHLMDNLDREMSSMTEAVTDLSTETYGYDLSYVLPGAAGSWTLGTDATLRYMEGFRTRDFIMGSMAGETVTDNVWQGGKRNRFGGVVEYQPNIADWNVVLASRFDYYYSNASDPDPYFGGNLEDLDQEHPGWSVSAGFTKDLHSNWTTGFWMGRSERYPGMDELFVNYLAIGMDPYEYVGNPQLKSELNRQVDAMLIYTDKSISAEGSLFYSYLTDYISAEVRPDLNPKQQGAPGVRQFVNVDEAVLYGFELTLKNNGRNDLGYNLSTAYTIGRNLTANEALPQIPAYEANLKVDYGFLNGKLIPRLHLRGVAAQTRVAGSFDEQPTDGYLITNVKLSSQLGRGMQLSAGVNNLFGVTYHEHLNRSLQGSTRPLNDPGRSLFVELKWKGVLSSL